jgi:hypothetical protein
MGHPALPPGAAAVAVDLSNAYAQDGSPSAPHRLWCGVLALLGVLLAVLPGEGGGSSGGGLGAWRGVLACGGMRWRCGGAPSRAAAPRRPRGG